MSSQILVEVNMSCCNNKSLKVVKNIEEAIVIAYVDSKMLLLHKDDIAAWTNDSNNIMIALKLGYHKELKKEELLDFDDVLNQLKNL